jgi:Tol biopolymer transport system component
MNIHNFFQISRVSLGCLYLLCISCSANDGQIKNITAGHFGGRINYANFNPVDNEEIYFTTLEGILYLFDLRTQKIMEVMSASKQAESIIQPKFSEDGSQIAFVDNYNLKVYDIAHKTVRQLTSGTEVWPPLSWRNDSEIFFTSRNQSSKRTAIEAVNVKSGAVSVVFKGQKNEDFAVLEYINSSDELFFYFNDNKSADITQPYVYRTKFPGSFEVAQRVNLKDEGIVREIGGELGVSSDGRALVFDGSTPEGNASNNIYMADTKTGKVRLLVTDGGFNIYPKFDSGMKKVLFLTQVGSEIIDIRVMDFNK